MICSNVEYAEVGHDFGIIRKLALNINFSFTKFCRFLLEMLKAVYVKLRKFFFCVYWIFCWS